MKLSVMLLLASIHLPDNSGYNNLNIGTGLEVAADSTSYSVFVYNNSYSNISYAASITKYKGNFGLGVVAATGYDVPIATKFSYTFAPFRVETSFPLNQVFGADDVFNLQLIFPIGGR